MIEKIIKYYKLERIDDITTRYLEKKIKSLQKIIDQSEEIEKYITHEVNQKIYKEYYKLVRTNIYEKNFEITAIIMTFNEERCIERCINSIIDKVDEIIIVDTGSIDNTIPIILKYKEKVKLYRDEWKGSFADIRNKMISLANGHIIFSIDADEYVECDNSEFREIIKYIFQDVEISDTLSPIIINHDGINLHFTKRIFKKESNLCYFGDVHEYLIKKGSKNVSTIVVDIKLMHDGYKDNIVNEKHKLLRNYYLGKKMIYKDEKNIRWYYFVAKEMQCMKKNSRDIIEVLQEGLKQANYVEEGRNFEEALHVMLGIEYVKLRKYQELKREYNIIAGKYPNNIDALYFKMILIENERKEINSQVYRVLDKLLNMKDICSHIDIEGKHVLEVLAGEFYVMGEREISDKLLSKKNDN